MANQAIDNALITEFSDIVQVKAQQTAARMRPYVRIKKMSGDIWAYDGLGDVEAAEIVGRNQPVTFQAIDHLRRKIARRRFAVTLPIDAADLRGSLLKNSEYADAVVNAINRKFDRICLDAMFADVLTGRDMGTTVTFASEGLTAVDATAGLTYAKLLEIKQNFIDNEVGNESPVRFVIGLSGKEHTKLMQEVQIISNDYVPEYVANKGVIEKAAGFDIVVFGASVNNPMLAVSGGERQCFALAAGPNSFGMVVGMSLDLKLDVSERKDLYETTQVQAIIEMGAVRTEGILAQKVRTTA